MADSDAADLAVAQHGVFSRRQLVGRGVATSTIDRRLAQGRWLRCGPLGIYQLAGTPVSLHSRLMAATLASDGAVASHQSAALLHGIGPLEPSASRHLHLTRAGTGAGHCGLWRTHRVVALDSRDRGHVEGIDCTSTARTVVDLAGVLSHGRFVEVFHRALHLPGFKSELTDAMSRLPPRGKRGAGLVRRLIDDSARSVEAIATSELEHRFLLLVVEFGLPTPDCQFLPPWRHDVGIGCVDFAYPMAQLLIEADGRAWHARERAFEVDRRRDQAATAAGWATLRFTWPQIVEDSAHVASIIRSALAVPRAA